MNPLNPSDPGFQYGSVTFSVSQCRANWIGEDMQVQLDVQLELDRALSRQSRITTPIGGPCKERDRHMRNSFRNCTRWNNRIGYPDMYFGEEKDQKSQDYIFSFFTACYI